MAIYLQNAVGRGQFRPPSNLAAQLRSAWRLLDGRSVDITVRIADDGEIKRLNARFRGKNMITDVLSFPYHAGEELTGGDLIIGWGRAKRQARSRGISLHAELLRLAIHGLAHVAGYDHMTREQFAAMRQVEFETMLPILARAGVKKL